MNEARVHTSYRWVMLAITMLAIMSLYMDMIAYAPVLQDIAKQLSIDIAAATNLMMGFVLAAACVLIWGGVVCDKYGVTVALVLGLACGTLPATIIPIIGHSYGLIFLSRLVQGAGVGIIFAVIGPILALWFPPKEQGLAGGLMIGSMSLGSAVGVVVSPILFGITGSWQTMVALLSLFGWGVILLAALFTRRPPPAAAIAAIQEAMAAGKGNVTFWQALRFPVTWVGSFIIFCNAWGLYCLYNLVPVYLATPAPMGLGVGPAMAGTLSLAVTTIGMIAMIAGGLFFDKAAKGNSRIAIVIGFALSGIFALLLIVPIVYANIVLLVLSLLIAGWGIPFMNASLSSYIATNYPLNIMGRMVGWWFGIGGFGGAAGLYVGGLSIGMTGRFDLSIVMISLAAGLGLILGVFLKPRNAPVEVP